MGYIQNALKELLPEEKLKLLPKGFERVGHVAVISLPQELAGDAGLIYQKLLELKGVRTVASREGPVHGRERMPTLRVVAGDPSTETAHIEHGCFFKLDVAKLMFSKGNVQERGRLPKLVRDGEVVVDMFTGVGQFSIPIAKHSRPSRVYSIEVNPVAHGYLVENVRINKVGHIVVPLLGDCEKVSPRGVADRVVMGLLHVTHKYLPLAMEVLKPEGGVIHYHETVPSKLRFERPVERITEAAAGREVKIVGKHFIKRYSPRVDHVVIDAQVGPAQSFSPRR
ncbi:MAG: class I SAM-dependent methyltransferase family protein [Candidatus Hadarchaeota archaeon]